MSKVTFVPKPGTEYESGWPEKVIGDGFINLELWEINYGEIKDEDESAIYQDQFHDKYYEFFDKTAGEWTVEVREDG